MVMPPPPPAVTQSESALLALREAALTIVGDLSLNETLTRIVEAAARLAGARYAALGVPDPTGETLVEFVTHGLTPHEEARLSHRPRGHGVLGLLLRGQQSLRLRNLSDHPKAVGFPLQHPHMSSFLGVPILYQGHNLGNLYLTNKRDAPEFTEADQALIELLAAHAGAAIQNARLYEESLQRAHNLEELTRELAAVNTVSGAVNRYLDLTRVMAEALDQVLAVIGAEAAEIFLFNDTTSEMTHALHRGQHPEAFQETRRFKLGEGFPGEVARTGRPLVSTDLRHNRLYLRRQVIEVGFKGYACVPLFAKDKVVGCLGLAAHDIRVFEEHQLKLLSAIGQQIGTAVENARLHRQVAQLAVLEERQRIGMDLHDGVIQSIYAVGLTLEFVDAQLGDGEVANARDRLSQAMQALNSTIRDIRSYILDLRPRRFEGDNLTTGLQRLLAEFKANTLMTIDFAADPNVDQALLPEARLALFHIAQEALSNAAKHSRATRMDVALLDDGDEVRLMLRDNGRGFQTEQVERRIGHGLVNMNERAQHLGGRVSFTAPPGQGAEVCVFVPKHAAPST